MKINKITTLAMFTTLALIIFTIENAIPALLPIPGIKLGLANIITLAVLHNYGTKDALIVLLMRIFLATFFYGQALSLLYSLAGGLLCIIAMSLIHKMLQGHFLFLISIVGALFHNIGQLFVAYLITEVPGVLVYLPFLLLSGILTGLFTGLCTQLTQRYLMPAIAALPFSVKPDGDN